MPCIKFEVSSSSIFGDMFDRMPKIVGVTWPRPRPLSGKIMCAPARHSPYKAAAHRIWSLYLKLFLRYCALNVLGARVWPFKVTLRHRSC